MTQQEESLAQLAAGIDWKSVRTSIERGTTRNMEDLTIVLHDIDRWRATFVLGECLRKRGRRNLREYERSIVSYKKGNIKRGDGKKISKKELQQWIEHHEVWIPNFREEMEKGRQLIVEARAALKPLIAEACRIREVMQVGERYDPRVHGRPGPVD